MKTETKQIGLVISGASGSILALETLRLLHKLLEVGADLRIHTIITSGAHQTAQLELAPDDYDQLKTLPHCLHDDQDMTANIASGSNALDALLFVPCSIRSLSAIAYGQTDRLSIRAADVMLKERRRLILCVRESPLHLGHLQAMQHVTQMGGVIAPPMPAFYLKPQSVDEMAQQTAARLLALADLDVNNHMLRWQAE